jgi:hypothetical protein
MASCNIIANIIAVAASGQRKEGLKAAVGRCDLCLPLPAGSDFYLAISRH